MLRELRASVIVLALLTLVTGFAYPLLVTAIARVAFPRQAGGSLIVAGGHVVGSSLLGQSFADSGRFWSRPSATATPYDAGASSGSNFGPTNPAWTSAVAARAATLRAADPGNAAPIPADLVTASGSGLDPDISPAAAEYQVTRIARVRGLDPARVRALVARFSEPRLLGIFGAPRVHVLPLNLALDSLAGTTSR